MSSLIAVGGCGGEQAQPAEAEGFGVASATEVLRAFDTANSSAVTANDEALLRTQEVEPALLFSVAALRSAQANERKQPAFQHINPAFAIPAEGSCFLAVAGLRFTGEEMERRDATLFVEDGAGGWRLSHNVLLGQETPADAVAIDAVGVATADGVPAAAQEQLAQEVFARTTGTTSPQDRIAQAPLLDKRLAGGWAIYQQQLSASDLTVTRRLDDFAVAPCAARVSTGTLLFLTLRMTDTVTAAPGKTTPATLPADSPDGVALGLTEDLRGKSISVGRTEVFLLSVRDGDSGAGSVLGLSDVATTVAVVD